MGQNVADLLQPPAFPRHAAITDQDTGVIYVPGPNGSLIKAGEVKRQTGIVALVHQPWFWLGLAIVGLGITGIAIAIAKRRPARRA